MESEERKRIILEPDVDDFCELIARTIMRRVKAAGTSMREAENSLGVPHKELKSRATQSK